jgi:tetratricopeptide (TPR) repeat protein
MRQGLLLFIFMLLAAHIFGQAREVQILQLAVDFTEQRKHPEAIKVCDKLTKLMPENEDVYYLRGINKYMMEDYEGAISDFDSVLMINPNHSDSYLYRAKSKKATKNYWGAMRDYNKAKDQNCSQTVTSLAGDMVKSIFGN